MITRLILVLLILAAGLIQPVATAGSAAKQSKQPVLPKTPADSQIERAIKTKLAKSKMRDEHFTVSVVKGEATLEGSTNVMQHKGAMTRMAKSSGAASVRNNIRVSDAARAKAVSALAKGRPVGPTAHTGAPSRTGATLASPPPIPRATVLPPGLH